MAWVKVASYSFVYEAQIAKTQLEAAGISVFIDNENLINMNWYYSNLLGEVTLYVDEIDFEDAHNLLNTDFSKEVDSEFDLSTPLCPNCGSPNISAYTAGKRSFFLTYLILGFPVAKVKQGYECENCKLFFDKI